MSPRCAPIAATFERLLDAHQDRINRLNVYPVPDGDTGTNMALTLEAVTAELDAARTGGRYRGRVPGDLATAR